jgi:hypothetical protein
MRRRRQANGVFISVTRTSDPSYLAELDPEQVESQLISRLELRFFRRRPSDSAVTGRQGRPFRVRTSRWLSYRPACAAFLLSPLCRRPGLARASTAARRRLASATPRNRTSLRPPRAVPASPGPACRARCGRLVPGDHARTHERTYSYLSTCCSPTRLSSTRHPLYCFTGRDLYQSGSPLEGPDQPLPGHSGGGGHSCLRRYPGGSTD